MPLLHRNSTNRNVCLHLKIATPCWCGCIFAVSNAPNPPQVSIIVWFNTHGDKNHHSCLICCEVHPSTISILWLLSWIPSCDSKKQSLISIVVVNPSSSSCGQFCILWMLQVIVNKVSRRGTLMFIVDCGSWHGCAWEKMFRSQKTTDVKANTIVQSSY